MLLRRRQRPTDSLTWVQSTNVNLLGGGAKPFSQIDWPNPPRGKPFPMDLRTFINAAEIHLIGKDKFYAGAGQVPTHSIPNPRGPLYPISLRTFTQNARLDLLGQDTFYGAAGMAVDFDYPNPTLRKSSAAAINAQPIFNSLATGQLASPFYQTDWPVPKGKAFPSDLRGFIHTSDTRLIGQDVFFAGAGVGPDYDYPNPVLRKSSTAAIASQPIPNNQQTTLFVQSTPFNQTDYQNPTLAKYNQARMGYVQAARTDLIGKDTFFAGAGQVPNVDAPNPTRAKPQTRTDIPPNLLAAGMLAAPPIQSEQSNRIPAKRTTQPDPTTNLLASGLLAAPFAQSEQANRLIAKQQPRVDAVPNLLTTTLASNTPFAQTQWDNPQAKRPAAVADRFSNLLLSSLFATPIGKLLDQPNPIIGKSRQVAVNAQQPMNLLRSTLAPNGGLLMKRRRHNAAL